MNISSEENRENRNKDIDSEVQKINDGNGLFRLWFYDLLIRHEERELDGGKDKERKGSIGKAKGKREVRKKSLT